MLTRKTPSLFVLKVRCNEQTCRVWKLLAFVITLSYLSYFNPIHSEASVTFEL